MSFDNFTTSIQPELLHMLNYCGLHSFSCPKDVKWKLWHTLNYTAGLWGKNLALQPFVLLTSLSLATFTTDIIILDV